VRNILQGCEHWRYRYLGGVGRKKATDDLEQEVNEDKVSDTKKEEEW
jgi:hypothetical protein